MEYLFNRSGVELGRSIEQPPAEVVKNTLSLWRASLDDAVRYGGELTRAALSVVPLKHDRKHVVVDTKVHMLMPGFYPAIPGWHTDGAPRDATGDPNAKGPPNVWLQEELRPVRYHLLVTGVGCLTQFLHNVIVGIDIPEEPTSDLYRLVTQQVAEYVASGAVEPYSIPSCQVATWDWWELHQGVAATAREWRFLIRVTETDYLEPCPDLREVLRTQSQVYAPAEFGW